MNDAALAWKNCHLAFADAMRLIAYKGNRDQVLALLSRARHALDSMVGSLATRPFEPFAPDFTHSVARTIRATIDLIEKEVIAEHSATTA